jgi:hypothetical protein
MGRKLRMIVALILLEIAFCMVGQSIVTNTSVFAGDRDKDDTAGPRCPPNC